VSGRGTTVAGLALVLAVGVGACGSDDAAEPTEPPATSPAETTTESAPERELPPPDALDLESIYGPALAELGLQLTDRGGVIDRTGGGYEPSATGRHLALYVEPTEPRTAQQYVDGIRDVAVVFADVFERWPGLESYDVCQEPEQDDADPSTEPLPVTQIELTKAEAAAIDWSTVTVAELVRSSRAEPPGIALRVSAELINDPAFEAVVEEIS
jgi:hypothetical protein